MYKNITYFLVVAMLFSFLVSCSSDEKTVYIKIVPNSHDFGQVDIGDTGTKDFVVTNKKKVDVTLSIVSFSTGEFSEISGALGKTITAGATYTVTVRFAPAKPAGAKSDAMHIEWTDANGKTGKVDVKLDGEAVAVPKINVTPMSHNFNDVLTNSTVTQDFTVENTGTADLTVSPPTLSGGSAVMFSITAGGAGGILSPGNNLTITVSFTPTSDGNMVADLEIPHDGINVSTPVIVGLEGVGTTPMIACTPNPLDFQKVSVGSDKTMKIDVDNAGSSALVVTAINLAGTNASEFVVQTALPLNVTPGSSEEVEIKFTPTAVGQRGPVTASFVNNTGTPEDVTLNGEGDIGYNVTPFGYGSYSIGGTNVFGSGSHDNESRLVQLGFTFNFFGNNYSQVYISTNGFITFTNQGTTASNPTAIPNASVPNNLIALFWDDLVVGSGDRVQYVIGGAAPNRTITIEYYSVSTPGGFNGFVYGQIKLYETTNVIELIYTDPSYWVSRYFDGMQCAIGIENATGTVGFETGAGTSPNITTEPRQSYRFTPN